MWNPPWRTSPFRLWFGTSVAVGQNGVPLVAYHGSPSTFEEFDSPRSFWNGFGSWFTLDDGYARKFAGDKGTIYAAYLRIEKPLRLRGDGPQGWEKLIGLYEKVTGVKTYDATREKNRQFRAYLRSQGYDGVILTNFKGDMGLWPYPQDFYIVLDSKQVKSIDNRGTFDPSDPNIFNGIG